MKIVLRIAFAMVWIVNGLWFKILDGEPRHRRIVGRILGTEHAGVLTVLIGVGELVIAAWILSGWRSRESAWAQIVLVMTMNVIEFVLVPDLLLFGRFNLLIAAAYCLVVAWSEKLFS